MFYLAFFSPLKENQKSISEPLRNVRVSCSAFGSNFLHSLLIRPLRYFRPSTYHSFVLLRLRRRPTRPITYDVYCPFFPHSIRVQWHHNKMADMKKKCLKINRSNNKNSREPRVNGYKYISMPELYLGDRAWFFFLETFIQISENQSISNLTSIFISYFKMTCMNSTYFFHNHKLRISPLIGFIKRLQRGNSERIIIHSRFNYSRSQSSHEIPKWHSMDCRHRKNTTGTPTEDLKWKQKGRKTTISRRDNVWLLSAIRRAQISNYKLQNQANTRI